MTTTTTKSTDEPSSIETTNDNTQRRIVVICNPNAGQKGGVSTNGGTAEQVRDLIDRRGFDAVIQSTSCEEDAVVAARKAVEKGIDIVVAAGGDGTVGTIASELIGSDTALGIIPLGSVMNIARMLEIPRDMEQAAGIIATGESRAIDVGLANGAPFFESGSVGLNAAVFREIQRIDDGKYRSVLTAIWTLLRYKPQRIVLHLDDRVMTTRALMVTVSNGPYTGLALTVAPTARVDDGKLDINVFRRFNRMRLIWHLATVAFGRRRYSPRIDTYRSSTVRIESKHPLPSRADSHDLGTTPVEFKVIPGGLNVVLPQKPPT